jgi:hypothetical protein
VFIQYSKHKCLKYVSNHKNEGCFYFCFEYAVSEMNSCATSLVDVKL